MKHLKKNYATGKMMNALENGLDEGVLMSKGYAFSKLRKYEPTAAYRTPLIKKNIVIKFTKK